MNAPKIAMVVWKAPLIHWVKSNTNDSLVDDSATSGIIYCDHCGTIFFRLFEEVIKRDIDNVLLIMTIKMSV